MTPTDVRMKYNKETGNETYPSINSEHDYVKWLEEELIKAWEDIAIGLNKQI